MNDKLFRHAGYEGSAEVSVEDECLYGKILGITDLVAYEADTVKQLHEAFVEAVDNYMNQCEKLGLKADTPSEHRLA